MDRENLLKLKALLNTLLGENEPSDEDLDYNEDAIEMYEDMHNLKCSMEKLGF